jgi:MFS family permease
MQQDHGSQRGVETAILASQFAPPFLFSGVAVALPAMGRELAASATQLSLVETLFLCASTASLLPIGRVADASDKRAVYLFGLFAFALLSVLLALAGSIEAVLLLRVLQGVSSATVSATGLAVLADLVPAERRARAFGAAIGSTYAGLSLGPMCAGAFVEWSGWRAVFWFGAALLTVAALVVARRLPWTWKSPRGAVHVPSALVVVAAVACAVVASSRMHHGAEGFVWLGASTLLVAWFVRTQKRLVRPLLDFAALRQNGALRSALLVQLVLYGNAFCVTFVLSVFLQVVLGEHPNVAGVAIASASMLMAVVAVFAGRACHRVGLSRMAAFGVACIVASSFAGLSLAHGGGIAAAFLVLGLQGTGFGLFSTPNMARIMASLPREQSGLGSSLGAMARAIGMMGGMLVANAAVAWFCGNRPVAEDPAAFTRAMDALFWALAATTTLSLLLAVRDARAGGAAPAK